MKNKLFKPAEAGGWNVVVGGQWASEWAYATGYMDAANKLVEATLSRELLDYNFYPICFLYRHAAEITLKDLIRDTQTLIDLGIECGEYDETERRSWKRLENKLNNTHDLGKLLDALLGKLSVVSDEAVPDEVCEAIRRLDAVDENGQTFRYARVRTRQGETSPSLSAVQHVDLAHLGSVLGEALKMLQWGVGGWLSHNTDLAQEMLSELRAAAPDYEAEMQAEYEAEMASYYGQL